MEENTSNSQGQAPEPHSEPTQSGQPKPRVRPIRRVRPPQPAQPAQSVQSVQPVQPIPPQPPIPPIGNNRQGEHQSVTPQPSVGSNSKYPQNVRILVSAIVGVLIFGFGLFRTLDGTGASDYVNDYEQEFVTEAEVVETEVIEVDEYEVPVSAPEPVPVPTTGYIDGHEWVDLGLSVKWATCNVGASSPSDYGNYYAWGETSPKRKYTEENSQTYRQNIGDIAGTYRDAATVNWGSNWRLPTKNEFKELKASCRWKWTNEGGYDGYRVTGPNGNSIFLPACGWRSMNLSLDVGSIGFYWTSTPDGSTVNACALRFYDFTRDEVEFYREYGYSVRPVSAAEQVSVVTSESEPTTVSQSAPVPEPTLEPTPQPVPESAPTPEPVPQPISDHEQPEFEPDPVPEKDRQPVVSPSDVNDDKVFNIAVVEQKPSFPGGDVAMYQWLAQNIVYPPAASEEGISGRVIVEFVVRKDGAISNARVIRSRHPALDAEALRIVNAMPNWIPGRNNGQPVNVSYTLPVTFRQQ